MDFLYRLMGITSAIADEAAGAAGTAAEGDVAGAGGIAAMLSMFLPMILIFVVFYFFLIRPQKKKEKKTKEMLDALKKGDRICTIGGIYGTIAGIKDDTITLIVGGEKMTMVVARWAIRSVEDVSVENEGEMLN